MALPLEIDPRLKEWATDRQKELIDAVGLYGSAKAAAKALGLNKSRIPAMVKSLQRRAARQGYSPAHNMIHTVPDSYRVKGVSTLYDGEGKVRSQWVKSEIDQKRAEELVREFVAHLAEEVRGLYPPTPAPERVMSDLMAVYLFGDPHFGMRATAQEAGEDFDLDEADRITRAGIDRLAEAAPASEEALLIVIGDNTHANDSSHLTPQHRNPLDMDAGGHNRSVLVSAKAWSHACKRLLEKHSRVRLWFMPGNHDPDAAFALALCLSMYFEAEPRLDVDLSPSLYRALRFGKVLIAAHHGHGAKIADLPLLLAVDSAEDWGASAIRYIYKGHDHHDTVKEIQGVRVEGIRTLAAKDAWHTGKGYRSMRDTRVIVHHREFGEVERHTVSAAMLAKP